jgi:hypothetical protein
MHVAGGVTKPRRPARSERRWMKGTCHGVSEREKGPPPTMATAPGLWTVAGGDQSAAPCESAALFSFASTNATPSCVMAYCFRA